MSLISDELANVCTTTPRGSEKLYSCKYSWMHIPTGKKGEDIFQTDNKMEFIYEINKWNKQQPGRWQYYY